MIILKLEKEIQSQQDHDDEHDQQFVLNHPAMQKGEHAADFLRAMNLTRQTVALFRWKAL